MSDNGGPGVTLSNADCSFMKLGASTVTTLDTATPQLSVLAGGRVVNGDNGLLSQGGDDRFRQRFALRAHTGYDGVQAMRFALEHQNPLETGEVAGGNAYPGDSFSLLSLSDPNVLLWTLKPADDEITGGIVARVWNLGETARDLAISSGLGALRNAQRVTHIETPTGAAPTQNGAVVSSIPAQGLRSYAFEIGEPLPPDPPEEPLPAAGCYALGLSIFSLTFAGGLSARRLVGARPFRN